MALKRDTWRRKGSCWIKVTLSATFKGVQQAGDAFVGV
jgi:hypothetical protein